MISVSSLASRVDGVWGVGLCCLLPSLRCLGKWAAPLGWGATCASLGAGRVATIAPCFAHTCGAELFHQKPTPAPSHGRSPSQELV